MVAPAYSSNFISCRHIDFQNGPDEQIVCKMGDKQWEWNMREVIKACNRNMQGAIFGWEINGAGHDESTAGHIVWAGRPPSAPRPPNWSARQRHLGLQTNSFFLARNIRKFNVVVEQKNVLIRQKNKVIEENKWYKLIDLIVRICTCNKIKLIERWKHPLYLELADHGTRAGGDCAIYCFETALKAFKMEGDVTLSPPYKTISEAVKAYIAGEEPIEQYLQITKDGFRFDQLYRVDDTPMERLDNKDKNYKDNPDGFPSNPGLFFMFGYAFEGVPPINKAASDPLNYRLETEAA